MIEAEGEGEVREPITSGKGKKKGAMEDNKIITKDGEGRQGVKGKIEMIIVERIMLGTRERERAVEGGNLRVSYDMIGTWGSGKGKRSSLEYQAMDDKPREIKSLRENLNMGQNTRLEISNGKEKKEDVIWKSKEVPRAIVWSSSSEEDRRKR